MSTPEFIKRHQANQQRDIQMRTAGTVPHEIRAEFLAVIAVNASRSDLFKTCLTCEYWGPKISDKWDEPICKKFNCLPPPAVIADGCEHYLDYERDIPF